jgi:hypothetical protein
VSKASEDFARARQAGEHHQLVARDLHVDVLQVVLARAADRDHAAAVEIAARTILVEQVVHEPRNIMRTAAFGYPSHDMAGLAGRAALWITKQAASRRPLSGEKWDSCA